MALSMYRGSMTEGEAFRDVRGGAVNVLKEIALGNSVVVQQMNLTNRFLDQFIKEVPCVPGEQVPVDTWNIVFSPGGISSDAPEFTKIRRHFDLKKESFKVLSYNFTPEMLRSSRNTGVNLMQVALEKTKKATDVYTNVYLPFVKLGSFISGDSAYTTVPVSNVGGLYTSQAGVLRGEDCSDWVIASVVNKNKNLLRCKRTTALVRQDIYDIVADLKDFKTNIGKQIVGVASSRTINEMESLYEWAENRDKFGIDGVPYEKIGGIPFVTIDGAPDGFLIFLVLGGDAPCIKAVEKDPMQRGLLATTTTTVSKMETEDEIDGMFLEICAEGYHFLRRETIAILDVENYHSSGDMTADGITALENYLNAIRTAYTAGY